MFKKRKLGKMICPAEPGFVGDWLWVCSHCDHWEHYDEVYPEGGGGCGWRCSNGIDVRKLNSIIHRRIREKKDSEQTKGSLITK